LFILTLASIVIGILSAKNNNLLDFQLNEGEKSGDPVSYIKTAKDILEGKIWSKYHYRPPGYPVIISLFLLFDEKGILVLRLFQIVCVSSLVFLIYNIGKSIFNKKVGLITSVWWVIYINKLYWSPSILREWLLVSLFVVFIWFLLVYKGKLKLLFSSITLSWLILTDPRFVFIFIILPFLYFVYDEDKMRKIKKISILWLFTFLIIGSWITLDSINSGKIIIINSRFTMHLSLAFNEIFHPEVNRKIHIENTNINEEDSINNNITVIDRGNRFIRIKNKFIEYWRFYRINTFMELGRKDQPMWSLKHNILSFVTYGIFLIFLPIGIFYIIKTKNKKAMFLLFLGIAHMLLHIIRHSIERYRFPLDPLWIMIMMYGMIMLFINVRKVNISNNQYIFF